MPLAPLDVHQASLADYLGWLKLYSPTASVAVPIFAWKNTEYSCNYSWTKQRDLAAGGFIPMDDLIIEVLDPMTEIPEPEQSVTFQERPFRIRSVKISAGKNPTLVCYDPARGS